MHGAITEVDEFFRMADRPIRSGAGTFMAIIGCRRCIATPQWINHGSVRNAAGKTAIPLLPILPIPARQRQPYRELNFRIAGRSADGFDFASRRHGESRRVSAGILHRKRPCGNHRGRSNGCMRQLQIHQALARLLDEKGLCHQCLYPQNSENDEYPFQHERTP